MYEHREIQVLKNQVYQVNQDDNQQSFVRNINVLCEKQKKESKKKTTSWMDFIYVNKHTGGGGVLLDFLMGLYMNWRRLDPNVETAWILSLFPRDIKSLICMKFEIDHSSL